MIRYYLDDAGFWFGTAKDGELVEAFDEFFAVLAAIRVHEDELVRKHSHVYAAEVKPDQRMIDFLFSPTTVPDEFTETRKLLAIDLDRIPDWEESEFECEVSEYDVTTGGTTNFAPSVAQAVAASSNHGPVAILALGVAREHRRMAFAVGGVAATLHIVTCSDDRMRFVRTWVESNVPQPHLFHQWTSRCFPDLEWTVEARNGLRSHSAYFFDELFPTTMRHFAVLNDEAAQLFKNYKPSALREARLSAAGVVASGESPNTRSNKSAKGERVLEWKGEKQSFEWHTKIRPKFGRIHFCHIPSDVGAGQIVIGLCVKHLTV